MGKTHWRSLFNPNYFGCYCFEDSKDIVLTIKDIRIETVTGEGGKKEDCTVMYFEEDVKPLICNKTNCKIMAKLYKSPQIEDWIGRKVQLYPDHNVRFGSDIVEGVRVRPFLPRETTEKPKCQECKKEIQALGKNSAQHMAEYTAKKYGKPLCAECATKLSAARKEADVL